MPPQEVQITIRMTGHDFKALSAETCAWEGGRWETLSDWYVVYPYAPGTAVSYKWLYAHWFETWVDVMHARSFLDAIGEGYQILSDESEDGKFVIVTNYCPGEDDHRRPKEETAP